MIMIMIMIDASRYLCVQRVYSRRCKVLSVRVDNSVSVVGQRRVLSVVRKYML